MYHSLNTYDLHVVHKRSPKNAHNAQLHLLNTYDLHIVHKRSPKNAHNAQLHLRLMTITCCMILKQETGWQLHQRSLLLNTIASDLCLCSYAALYNTVFEIVQMHRNKSSSFSDLSSTLLTIKNILVSKKKILRKKLRQPKGTKTILFKLILTV